eukprot:TRINITY_DN1876_c0_g1_i3.p1 TRINITY_DN1876_c0_g1~~TRINITY_DN1876_c0_g1_i3.p1  ORF type:complete len:491 (-),score=180.47 TRINITY_DN1876_c0_g1_i3:220-1692(-)
METSDDKTGEPWARLFSLNPKRSHVDIRPDQFLIGRSTEECNLAFDDKLISTKHCRIYRESGIIFCEDLSSNGTYINGKKLGKGQQTTLHEGDEISIVVPSAKAAKTKPSVQDTFVAYIFKDLSAKDEDDGISKLYEIGKELGTGNFATVKLCVSRDTGETYAVKIIDKKKFATNSALRKDQLADEVRVMKALQHPNVLSIIDLFETEDTLYMILELIKGGDLFDAVVNKEYYSEDEARVIFGQLASAVGYLHDQQIAHRDLKPENILMKDASNIKLSDFGLSKIVGEEQMMKTLCGTPQYLAPEIIFASQGIGKGSYSKAVDLWSMGVILYILLAGFPPFGDNSFEKIKKGQYSFKDPRWKAVSDEAKDLITKLMTVDVDKRCTINGIFEHKWMSTFKRIPGKKVELSKTAEEAKKAEKSDDQRAEPTQEPESQKPSDGDSQKGDSQKASDEEAEEAPKAKGRKRSSATEAAAKKADSPSSPKKKRTKQ